MPNTLSADRSVILFDNDDTGGVDAFLSVFGHTDQKDGGVILTLPAPSPPSGVLEAHLGSRAVLPAAGSAYFAHQPALSISFASHSLLSAVCIKSVTHQQKCGADQACPAASSLPCCPADVDFGLFVLPDSDNDDIQLITDSSVIKDYPTLNNEASCTSNCLFKRSKDAILHIGDTSQLFHDFTHIVALWSQDSVDSATGAQSVSSKLLSGVLLGPASPTLCRLLVMPCC